MGLQDSWPHTLLQGLSGYIFLPSYSCYKAIFSIFYNPDCQKHLLVRYQSCPVGCVGRLHSTTLAAWRGWYQTLGWHAKGLLMVGWGGSCPRVPGQRGRRGLTFHPHSWANHTALCFCYLQLSHFSFKTNISFIFLPPVLAIVIYFRCGEKDTYYLFCF